MQLTSFSVRKYRSIISAEKLPLGNLTVLIGPNNEGKSNILRALVVGMRLLRQARAIGVVRGQYRLRSSGFESDYLWERDYPVSLRDTEPEGDSVFDFEFALDDAEIADFFREVQSNLNGVLPIRLSINPKRVLFQVRKRGPGAQALTAKRDEIASYLSARLDLDYVPAVRTADQAMNVVRDLVESQLAAVEGDPRYQAALAEIEALQQPVFEELSASLGDTLRDFLPNVANVEVDVTREARTMALRREYRVLVDDGTSTDLRQKGDGVQSLVALSLIQHASQQEGRAEKRILAVEEPEAHLHPEAIHQLRRVLEDIATRQQVIVTTHCPVLVNRLNVGRNIIVSGNSARSASSVREIRDVLGVRTSDNLSTADVVLVVEGDNDRVALRALIAHESPVLRQALSDGLLAVDELGGGAKLNYKLGLVRDSLCIPHAFLDNDDTGRDAGQKAIDAGLLEPIDRTLTSVPGLSDSELEDLYDPLVYAAVIQQTFGVDLAHDAFGADGRWGERIQWVFAAHGQPWDVPTAAQTKRLIATAVATSPEVALDVARRGPIDALVAQLTEKLER